MLAGQHGSVAADLEGELRERRRAWERVVSAQLRVALRALDLLVVVADDGGGEEEEGGSGVCCLCVY